ITLRNTLTIINCNHILKVAIAKKHSVHRNIFRQMRYPKDLKAQEIFLQRFIFYWSREIFLHFTGYKVMNAGIFIMAAHCAFISFIQMANLKLYTSEVIQIMMKGFNL